LIKKERYMNRLLELCLVAVTLFASFTSPAAAQSAAPALRKGISVQMPVTSNAVTMPDADTEDAVIVSITAGRTVYLGIEPVRPAALAERLKGELSPHREKKVYIKADARTPYANVVQVLQAVRTAGVEAPILLTAQREPAVPGTVAPPRGLEVLVSSPVSSGVGPVIVEVLKLGDGEPALKIQNESVALGALNAKLKQLFNGSEKVVLLSAKGNLSFADVATVTDACRATGAKVFLLRAER
jgi:biopolymer transport protein ExbD